MKPRRERIFSRAFIDLWIVAMTTFFGFQLLTAALPLYAVRLGADDAVIGLMIGLVAVVALFVRPLAGWWVDRGNGVAPLTVGAAIYALCALGYWLAPSVSALLALRATSGLAIAFFVTASQALAANLAPAQRRGEALSLFGLAATLSGGIAPPAGVAISQAAGYPVLFAACMAAGLLGMLLAGPLRSLPPNPADHRSTRLINLTVLMPGSLLVTLAVTFGTNVALLAVHASRRDLSNPGMVFVAQAAGLLLAQTLAGRLSDRYGRLAVIWPALVLASAGMWATSLLYGGWLLVAALLSGLGLGLGNPALYALAADLVPAHERGSAMGTMGVFHEIGIGMGAIGGGLLGRAIGLGQMYLLAGFLPALGAAFALALSSSRVGKEPPATFV
ncbi:MAG: MFS transporter [bacterium]|nr:MFS transporter [bacterium]